MKVALLYGGSSPEHQVSCWSALSIFETLKQRHQIIRIGIDQSFSWYLQADDDPFWPIVQREDALILLQPGRGLFALGNFLDIDVLFFITHGRHGEDGQMSALAHSLQIPFVGSDIMASAIGMDKIMTKRLIQSMDIPTLPFVELTRITPRYDLKVLLNQRCGKAPWIAKCARGGSSLGVRLVEDSSRLDEVLDELLLQDSRLLIEPFGRFRELECALLGNLSVERSVVAEVIVHGQNVWYDFEKKYQDPQASSLDLNPLVDPAILATIDRYSREIYQVLDLYGLARIDFFFDPKTSELFFNELNTLPGFTSSSLYPQALVQTGISFADLLDALLDSALVRSPS